MDQPLLVSRLKKIVSENDFLLLITGFMLLMYWFCFHCNLDLRLPFFMSLQPGQKMRIPEGELFLVPELCFLTGNYVSLQPVTLVIAGFLIHSAFHGWHDQN